MVVDVVTFNGEFDLFELRYQILKDYVDEFIVVEFDKTFSGKDKPNYVKESANVYYDPINQWPKVKYFSVEDPEWEKYRELAESSPNTKGAEHWKMEFMMKESIKDCLTHLNDEDIVFIGDCDEIWDPRVLKFMSNDAFPIMKYRLNVYTYYLNNHSNEDFWGFVMARYKDIKNECLNHLRSNARKTGTDIPYGWHFTSLKDNLKRKLKDSYTEETYASNWVMDHLKENIENNKDFLGRDFTYQIDESEWPQYLKDNREKYKHLLK